MSDPSILQGVRDLCPALSVGIISADLMSLGSGLSFLEQAGTRLVHIDVMDGCFCPMMTVGPPVIKAMKTRLLKDVHLMIADPLEKVGQYIAAGADIISVHPESGPHTHRLLQQMRRLAAANDPGRRLIRGVALNPGTPLSVLEPLLDEMEMVLVLAVNPGWKGQEFIASTWGRIEKVKRLVKESRKDVLVAVDGGITRTNIAEVARTGVDIIVAGSAVFDGKAPEANLRSMMAALPARATSTASQ